MLLLLVGGCTDPVNVVTPIPPTAYSVTPIAPTGPQSTLEGWSDRNGHYYRLTNVMSWSDAEALAVQWGGHLVTINDREEELWLRSQFGSQTHFWIGFNDIGAEGIWVWAGGEPATYTNWCEAEPNNHSGENRPEDAAIMNWAVGGTYGDCWNDIPSDGYSRGIVERFP